jgi:hypothetical protein
MSHQYLNRSRKVIAVCFCLAVLFFCRSDSHASAIYPIAANESNGTTGLAVAENFGLITAQRHYVQKLHISDTAAHTLISFPATGFSQYSSIQLEARYNARDSGGNTLRTFAIRVAQFHTEAGTLGQDGSTVTLGTDFGADGVTVAMSVSGSAIVVQLTSSTNPQDVSVFVQLTYYGIA